MELAEHLDHMVLFSGDGDFRRWSRRCSAAACASSWSPPSPRSRRWSPTNCAARPTTSSTWSSCRPRSAATRPTRRPPREPRHHAPQSCSARPRCRRGRCRRRFRRLSFEARRRAYGPRPALRRTRPRLPALPAARRFRDEARAARAGLVQRAGAVLRRRQMRALLIVGLAPGLRGANRTGRPFTGDYAGDLLYATLLDFGFAARRLSGAAGRRAGTDRLPRSPTRCAACRRRTSRCRAEINTCRRFLTPTIAAHAASCARSWRSAASRTNRRCGRWACAPPPPVRPRRACTQAGGVAAVRQLSLLALQHQHRRADDADVPRRVRTRARSWTLVDLAD